MFGLGPQELIIILIIVVLLFGGKKIPEIMRGLGQGLREFKSASTDKPKKAAQLDDPHDASSADDDE